MKRIILISVFSAATLFAIAQDTIQLTWQGGTNKELWVGFNYLYLDRPIRFNWGDGFITDTLLKYYSNQKFTHTYADTTRNYTVTITSYRDTVLLDFYCQYQQVSRLDISRCAFVMAINCIGNRLPLSELYKIWENIKLPDGGGFGIQHLFSQQMLVGSSVDFSDQAEFGDTATVFNIEKNGIPAALNKIIPFTMV